MPPAPPQKENGVLWLIDMLTGTEESFTVLTFGPLTDLALAMRIRPEVSANIEELLIVGGGHRYTDVSAAAEFNFRYDPKAAAIVMVSDVPKTFLPLDCAYSIRADVRELDAALAHSTRGELIRALADPLFLRYRSLGMLEDAKGIPLPAILGVCALDTPTFVEQLKPYHVDVDCRGGFADGRTVFDTRNIFDAYNCKSTFYAETPPYFETVFVRK